MIELALSLPEQGRSDLSTVSIVSAAEVLTVADDADGTLGGNDSTVSVTALKSRHADDADIAGANSHLNCARECTEHD